MPTASPARLDVFREIATDVVERALPPLTEDTSIVDLDVDSLLMFEIVAHLERRAGVELADEDFASIRTIGDLLDRLAARRAAADDDHPAGGA